MNEMNFPEGITVLSQFMYKDSDWFVEFFVLLLIMLGAGIIIFALWDDFRAKGKTISFAVIVVLVAAFVYLTCFYPSVCGYKITVDENVNAKWFVENLTVLNIDGNIVSVIAR